MSSTPFSEARPALFLDRDGVINVDRGFVAHVADFEWIDGAIDAIRNFQARNWRIFVVTNQSGIAFGHYSEDDMQVLHDWMIAELARHGTGVDCIYHCPYHPDAPLGPFRKDSFDHKPKPGMLLQAMTDFSVDRHRSFLIGDKPTDLAAATAAGIPGYLFRGGNLADFAEWALASANSER